MATKKSPTKAKKLTEKAAQVYLAELTIGTLMYHAGGATAGEALDELVEQIPVELMKTKAVLTVTKDGKVRKEMLYPFKMRRFCTNPITRKIWAKVFAPK